MKIDVEQVDTCVRRLMIEVPADRVDREFETLYRNLQRRVKIPGFRPGKIPRRILENRYHHTVEQEVLQKLVPDVLAEALTQEGIRSVGQPNIDQIDLHKDQPLRFVATAQVLPDFTLGEYHDWQFERRIMAVEDEHIDQTLEQLRDRHAELHTVSGRAITKGDFAIINYQGVLDGQPLAGGSGTGVSLEVGAGVFLPEIEEGLVALEQGAEQTIPVQFAEDYSDSELAGKRLEFNVTVVEIKEKRLPELDDEFAQSYEDEDTIEALRQRVRGELEERSRQSADGVLRRDILSKLVAENPIDVPEVLWQEQMRQMYMQQQRQEMGRDLREEDVQLDPDLLRERFGEQALEAVRGQVILHHLEETLEVSVTPEEVDAEVASLAARMAQNPEALKQTMERNGSLGALRARLQEQNVFEVMIAAMQITDTVVSESELAPANEDGATALPGGG